MPFLESQSGCALVAGIPQRYLTVSLSSDPEPNW